MKRHTFLLILGVLSLGVIQAVPLLNGADQIDKIVSLLKSKRVGLVVNHTSLVGDKQVHLLDTLLSRGVHVVSVFAPEHGFRGNADAGATDGTTGKGRKLGAMTGIFIDTSGRIYGTYDNGNTELLGQIAVAQFSNASGLEKVGESCYRTTLNSGEFDGIGVEISADGSSMTTGELEMSNVDLSSEFTSMITTQRGFQANSRVITTSDTLLEELVNLKR